MMLLGLSRNRSSKAAEKNKHSCIKDPQQCYHRMIAEALTLQAQDGTRAARAKNHNSPMVSYWSLGD